MNAQKTPLAYNVVKPVAIYFLLAEYLSAKAASFFCRFRKAFLATATLLVSVFARKAQFHYLRSFVGFILSPDKDKIKEKREQMFLYVKNKHITESFFVEQISICQIPMKTIRKIFPFTKKRTHF
jgi:hypothetical protein